MPMYKEHLFGGFASGMVVLFLVANYLAKSPMPIATSMEWMMFVLAGSLFPDIDIKSKGQKLFYWIIVGLVGLSLYKGHLNLALYLALFSILPMLVRHRGIFHATWFVIAVPISGAVIAAAYLPAYRYSLFYDAAFFIAGALSHLIMDFGVKGLVRVR